jgi:hypothetical protein
MLTSRVRTTAIAIGFAALFVEAPALACGVSAGGAPGLCSVEEHEAANRKWRIGAGYTLTTTRIQFSNGSELPAVRNSSVVTLDRQIGARWALQVGAGAFLTGQIGDRSMDPGAVFAVSAAWRVLDQAGFGKPFLLLTTTLAGLVASSANPTRTGYQAFDLRLGAVLGTRVPLGRAALLPYAVGRVFGGPIFFSIDDKAVTGTDAYKHQLGAGATITFRRFDVFVEAIAMGERSMSAGLGVAF